MPGIRDPSLERVADSGSLPERAWAAIELGRVDQAERAFERLEDGDIRRGTLIAALHWLQGDFHAALRASADGGSDRCLLRARIWSSIGQHDQALRTLAEQTGAEAALGRAEAHWCAGEPGPATIALPKYPLSAAGTSPHDLACAHLSSSRLMSLRAELAMAERKPREALLLLRTARDQARSSGSPTAEADALARLGDAHARAGQRWRALRAVTGAVDLVAAGRVHPASLPGVLLRASRIYHAYGHQRLAMSAIETAHTRVVQIASGIEEREYRESFFMENRDCQGVVAAWKGDPAWGAEIRGL